MDDVLPVAPTTEGLTIAAVCVTVRAAVRVAESALLAAQPRTTLRVAAVSSTRRKRLYQPLRSTVRYVSTAAPPDRRLVHDPASHNDRDVLDRLTSATYERADVLADDASTMRAESVAPTKPLTRTRTPRVADASVAADGPAMGTNWVVPRLLDVIIICQQTSSRRTVAYV
jgi:hypothetical protein